MPLLTLSETLTSLITNLILIMEWNWCDLFGLYRCGKLNAKSSKQLMPWKKCLSVE